MLTQGFYPPRMDYSGYFIPSGYYPITPPYNHPYDYQLISGPSQDIHLESTANYLSASSNVAYQSYPQFPTPPLSTSPHATTTIATPVAVQRIREDKRTTSVIMKIEDQKVFEIKTNNSVSNFTSGIASSSSASSVSESEDDTICKWENCYSIFERLDTLASHVTQKHAVASAGGLYFCKWEGCPRSERGFNARYKMLVHVRTHTKEKPHHCPQCNKCFSRAENLKIHTRSHSGEKPYICPVEGCTKAYSNSSDRFKHTRTHSTEKPYTCKIPGCSKRYTDPSSLRKHVKTFKHTTYANGGGSPNTEAHHYMKKHDFEQHKEQPQPKIIPDRPVAICSCSRNCFDHVCRTEGYRFGGHFLNNTFNPTILMYDQQLAGTRDRGPTDYSTDFKFERMDVDAPLDLSVSNKSRQLF